MIHRDIRKFCLLCLQLVLLVVVFRQFRVEEPAFLLIAVIAFAGFALHYWLPARTQEWFFVALSMGGAFLVLDPQIAGLLQAGGLLIYLILALPIAFAWRAAIITALFVVLIGVRARLAFGIPAEFWPLFGSIFMFRLIVYLYDLKHAKTAPGIREFLSYFYLLPNYYFLLFPVVDFATMRRNRNRRDVHDVAQQGIHWMVRGTVQLLIYRMVTNWRGDAGPETVTSFGALVLHMVLTFMLYLRVSGQFHIIVGMLHLFGYDLPETNRRYALASSFLDLWRRINIYWKDFMVKVFYFPLYFSLRRKGDVRAQLLATALVFGATWALHSYQYFWMHGYVLLSATDALFWTVLGLLVMTNVAIEARVKKKPAVPGWRGRVTHSLRIAGTMSALLLLWSMWSAPSLDAWVDLLTWWKIG